MSAPALRSPSAFLDAIHCSGEVSTCDEILQLDTSQQDVPRETPPWPAPIRAERSKPARDLYAQES